MKKTKPMCGVDGCEKVARSHSSGLCEMHYYGKRRHGDVSHVGPRGNPAEYTGTFRERMERKINKEHPLGCWEWMGGKIKGYGYLQSSIPGVSTRRKVKTYLCHKYLWEERNGPTPEGLVLDHFQFPEACIGPGCCNPCHLKPVTQRENTLRSHTALPAINARKTHCKYGHRFSLENTYTDKQGHRTCKICRARRLEEYWRRKNRAGY